MTMPGQDFDPGLIEALKERHQQQMVEAIERHQQTYGELEESLAQIVYEQAIIPAARHCFRKAPKWVAGGNSITQDDARIAARAIIRRWPREEQVIAENIQRQLLRRIDTLETELERERLRLTACGVAAKADTPESAAKARNCHPDYCSASLDNVCDMVDKLMEARARLQEQESMQGPSPQCVADGCLEEAARQEPGSPMQQLLSEAGGLLARWGRAMVDQVVPHEEVPHEDWPPLELERLCQRQHIRAQLLAINEELATLTDEFTSSS